ncbi:MAG: MerR family transcriptional regulator [Blastocatellales bacterium]
MASDKAYSPGQENLTASDVLKLAGLTYRQLHDWEKRAGIIEAERLFPEGWRKFTFESVLALAICTRLREKLGISLEKTGTVYKWLIGDKTSAIDEILAARAELEIEALKSNPTTAAIVTGRHRELKEHISDEYYRKVTETFFFAEINKARIQPALCALKIAQLGLPVYLVSDLTEYSAILSENNLATSVRDRLFKVATIILPLNDLLNPLMERAKIPSFELDKHFTSYRAYWDIIHQEANLSQAEKEMLRLVRERDYQRVTAHVQGGVVLRIETEEDLAPQEQDQLERQILDAIRSGEHQTITLKKCNGKIVRINRTKSIKLD